MNQYQITHVFIKCDQKLPKTILNAIRKIAIHIIQRGNTLQFHCATIDKAKERIGAIKAIFSVTQFTGFIYACSDADLVNAGISYNGFLPKTKSGLDAQTFVLIDGLQISVIPVSFSHFGLNSRF